MICDGDFAKVMASAAAAFVDGTPTDLSSQGRVRPLFPSAPNSRLRVINGVSRSGNRAAD